MSDIAFDALRAIVPADLDAELRRWTASDVERATAMLADLLASLTLPPASRVLIRVDPSIEALLLRLAVQRTGHTAEPVDPSGDEDALAAVIAADPSAVVVCRVRDFQWLSRLAFTAGTGHVFTLDADRNGSLLARAAQRASAFESP